VIAGFLMAVRTYLTQPAELSSAVAHLTIEQLVPACQGKGGIRMVEGKLIPSGRCMAEHTGTPQLTGVGIHMAVRAVFIAGLQHGFPIADHMTGRASDF
jgi:hypothetical protein